MLYPLCGGCLELAAPLLVDHVGSDPCGQHRPCCDQRLMREIDTCFTVCAVLCDREQSAFDHLLLYVGEVRRIIRGGPQLPLWLLTTRVGAAFAEGDEPKEDAAGDRRLSRAERAQDGIGSARKR